MKYAAESNTISNKKDGLKLEEHHGYRRKYSVQSSENAFYFAKQSDRKGELNYQHFAILCNIEL